MFCVYVILNNRILRIKFHARHLAQALQVKRIIDARFGGAPTRLVDFNRSPLETGI